MAFRTDSIESFPFSDRTGSVWYILTDWKNKTQTDFHFVEHKKNLVLVLQDIINNSQENEFELMGVWQGQRRTDIFKLPVQLAFKEINKAFGV